jgi:hypothetical protein
MFGIFLKKKRLNPSNVRTIPMAELAPLWRDPDEFETFLIKTETGKFDVPQGGITDNKRPGAVDLETLVTRTDLNPPTNNNDAWYDEKALIAALKGFLSAGKTFAFVYEEKAYYTFDAITEVLNAQRAKHNLDFMDPKAVIDFFKQGRGLDSGKYVMRFESGLPTKIYLYIHPAAVKNESSQQRPIDETGRRLKSLKPIKEYNP